MTNLFDFFFLSFFPELPTCTGNDTLFCFKFFVFVFSLVGFYGLFKNIFLILSCLFIKVG